MGIVAIFFKENTIKEIIVFFFGGWTVAWYIIISNYDFKKWKEELFNKHKIL
jgi:hypothetical protein